MSNGSGEIVIPFSASQGGYPVLVDDASVPGKVLHQNTSTSDQNDLLEVRVVNLNPAAISLYYVIQGGSILPATSRDQMDRVDIAPTPTGEFPSLTELPQIVGAGYSLYVSADNPAGLAPLFVYGHVHRHTGVGPAVLTGGRGGLLTSSPVAIADITAGNWATVPFSVGALSNPLNFTQDFNNNQFSLDALGVWALSMYGVFSANKMGADRQIYIRFYNVTQAAPIPTDPFPIFTENNDNGSMWSLPFVPIEVVQAELGNSFRLELGGSTSNYTNISLLKAGLSAVRVSDTI